MRLRYAVLIGLAAGLVGPTAVGCSKSGNTVEAPAKYTDPPTTPPVGSGGEGGKPIRGKTNRGAGSGIAE